MKNKITVKINKDYDPNKRKKLIAKLNREMMQEINRLSRYSWSEDVAIALQEVGQELIKFEDVGI